MTRALALKSQDVVILLRLASGGSARWTYASLAASTLISQSEVHACIKRCQKARLLDPSRRVRRTELFHFLVHGVPYAFPAEPGPLRKGVALSYRGTGAETYVWPDRRGHVQGYSIVPLHPAVSAMAAADPLLHELFSAVDSLRLGDPAGRVWAESRLRQRLLDPEANPPLLRRPLPSVDPQERKDRILRAAELLFADRGFKDVHLSDVAATVGLEANELAEFWNDDLALAQEVCLLQLQKGASVVGPGVLYNSADLLVKAFPKLLDLVEQDRNLYRTHLWSLAQHELFDERLRPLMNALVHNAGDALGTVEFGDKLERSGRIVIFMCLLQLYGNIRWGYLGRLGAPFSGGEFMAAVRALLENEVVPALLKKKGRPPAGSRPDSRAAVLNQR